MRFRTFSTGYIHTMPQPNISFNALKMRKLRGIVMTDEKIDKVALQAQTSLRKAVHKELQKKAKLGQYAIIDRNGKPVRVKASEIVGS